MALNQQLWVEKYRPDNFETMTSQKWIFDAIRKALEDKYLFHLIFYGQSGVGKTSGIISLGKAIYKEHYNEMVIHLNASDDRGIGTIRNLIQVFISNTPLNGLRLHKLVILDEIDSMTIEAQRYLQEVISKSKNTVFCLISNNYYNIIQELKSRCIKNMFLPISYKQSENHIKNILEKENISPPDDPNFYEYIYFKSNGDLRKYINIVHSASIIDKNLTLQLLCELYGENEEIDIAEIKSCHIKLLIEKYRHITIDDFVNKSFKKMFDCLKDTPNLAEFIIDYESILKGITISTTHTTYMISLIEIMKSFIP